MTASKARMLLHKRSQGHRRNLPAKPFSKEVKRIAKVTETRRVVRLLQQQNKRTTMMKAQESIAIKTTMALRTRTMGTAIQRTRKAQTHVLSHVLMSHVRIVAGPKKHLNPTMLKRMQKKQQ